MAGTKKVAAGAGTAAIGPRKRVQLRRLGSQMYAVAGGGRALTRQATPLRPCGTGTPRALTPGSALRQVRHLLSVFDHHQGGLKAIWAGPDAGIEKSASPIGVYSNVATAC